MEDWDIGFDERAADTGTVLRDDSIVRLDPLEPPLAELLPLDPGADLHCAGSPSGMLDPDELVLADEQRPLVLYGLAESRSLTLAKSAGRIRVAF